MDTGMTVTGGIMTMFGETTPQVFLNIICFYTFVVVLSVFVIQGSIYFGTYALTALRQR